MKVLIVEDHPIVVSGCSQLFAEHAAVMFLTASTIAEARREVCKHEPEVIVLDVHLPDGSGLEFVRQSISGGNEAKILVFSMTEDVGIVMRLLDYGARCFVSKNDKPVNLLNAVEAVARGDIWLSDDLLQRIALMRAASREGVRLTRREKNVVRLLIEGHHQSEIAHALNISQQAVLNDCATARQKLNARTTTEMVAIAKSVKSRMLILARGADGPKHKGRRFMDCRSHSKE